MNEFLYVSTMFLHTGFIHIDGCQGGGGVSVITIRSVAKY